MKTLRIATIFAAALSLPLTAACDDESDPDADDPAALRVVHAAPDAPPVDIYAAGSAVPLIEGLRYGEASDYLELPAGSYDIEIRAAGAPPSSAPVHSTGPLSLSAGARVTALAAGLLGPSSADQQFRVIPLAERFAPPAAGNAVVRIAHASADAPTVAIDVGNDGTPEIDQLARFEATGAPGVELPADTPLPIGIWAGDPLARVTSFTTPALPEAAELFVVATGLLDREPREADAFSLLAIAPSGAIGFIDQDPTVFALHASPDAPPVDIFAGETMLAADLGFGELSAPIQISPGSYALDFYATGTGPGTPAAAATTPELAAGERYLAIASGYLSPEVGEPGFQLIPVVDEIALGDGNNARLAVVHASPDAPPVDIGTVTGATMDTPVLVGDLAFPETAVGQGISVPPAQLTLGVAATGSADPVATFDVTTTAGLRTYGVAAGSLAPAGDEQSFRLLLVITSEWPWIVAEVLPGA